MAAVRGAFGGASMGLSKPGGNLCHGDPLRASWSPRSNSAFMYVGSKASRAGTSKSGGM